MPFNNLTFKAFLMVAFFFIICIVGSSLFISHWFSVGCDPEGEGRSFMVKEGWSVQTVANQLAEDELITHPELFIWASRFLGQATHIHAGEYLISPHMSPAAILGKMVKGDVILHRVTLPEGVTSAQFVEHLINVSELDGPVTDIPSEGSLLPETYTFTRGAARNDILQDMQKEMQQLVDKLWSERPEGFPLKSKQELITLASIVEKETAIPSERPVIAAVFLNRLIKGMPLQADPTVVYGITMGKGPLGRSLLRSDLEQPSPYNTYLNRGLPMGPIANPGRASLEAVMKPADVKYLYFVADGKGGHIFAETLAQHQKNHAAWRRIRANQ